MRADILESDPFEFMKLETVDVQYALFLCLQYVSDAEQVTQMLIYVLLCSAILADYTNAQKQIHDIIDCMAEVIGKDFAAEDRNGPMEIFGLLDKDTRRVLFKNMIGPAKPNPDSYEVIIAKKQLAERLALLKPARTALFDEAEVYLKQSGEYLHRRYSEIVSRIISIWLSPIN
jgi:hypothetical protein